MQAQLDRAPESSDLVSRLERWTEFWHFWISVLFLKGYLAVAREGNFLPKSDVETNILLESYLINHTWHEITTELSSSTKRVLIPCRAIVRLLHPGG
jgi:maltose alpha-D-glucosyltransferase/alpha-amylase